MLWAFAAAAIGLIGQLGLISAWADSVNYLTPLWLVSGIVAATVVAVRTRADRRSGLALIAILLATGGVNMVRAAPAPVVHGDRDLRLVQFNVAKANRSPERAARWVLEQGADIVVLEEVAGNGGEVRDLLTPAYPYAIDCLDSTRRCSTAILSRQAPVRSGGLARGDPENRKALSAAWATFTDDRGEFTVIGVHLTRPWPYGDQAENLGRLKAFLSGTDPRRLIIAGDFNQPPWTFAMRRQDRTIGLPRLTGRVATWPVGRIPTWGPSIPLPTLLPIDHIYAGTGWGALSLRGGPDLGSDHRPLVVDFATTQVRAPGRRQG